MNAALILSLVVLAIGTIEVSGREAAGLESPAGAARARVIPTELLESIPCSRGRYANLVSRVVRMDIRYVACSSLRKQCEPKWLFLRMTLSLLS